MTWRYFQEKFTKGVFFLSASSTSIIILMIIFFLFQQGFDIVGELPLEDDIAIVVNENVPVRELSPLDIKNINDRIVTNWNEFRGGVNQDIIYITDDDIDDDETLMEVLRTTPFSVGPVYLDEWEAEEQSGLVQIELENISYLSLLVGEFWFPTAEPVMQLGIMPLILASLLVTFGSILFATPIGIGVAVYLSEIADPTINKILKPFFEILAGIPSVVFGFFGLVIVVPLVQETFSLPVGETALVGMIVLAVMALPTIISVAEDSLSAVPKALREASLALGATKWQTIYKVIIPAGFSGITTGVVLGIGRVIGETMVVLMVTGNAAAMPDSILKPVRTMTATIAAELGEAPFGGVHFKSLFFIACVLFIFTLLINLIAEYLIEKQTKN